MNTIYKFFFIFTTILLFSSCGESVLDKYPTNQTTTEVVLNDLNSIKAALTGCYDGLQSSSYYGRNFFVIADLYGDNAKISSNSTGRFNSFYNLSVVENDDILYNLWQKGYSIINNANNIISAIPTIEEGSDVERNQILGEAKAIRAMVYFDLLRLFSQTAESTAASGVPNANGNGEHLGIPLVLSPTHKDSVQSVPRAKNIDVTNNIIWDLKSADTLLSITPENPYSISQNAIYYLLGKVYEYRGVYNVAFNFFLKVYNSGNYTLTANENYIKSWSEEYTSESIFSIAMSSTDFNNTNSLGYLYSISGYNEIVPSQDLAELFGNDNDIRKELYVAGSEVKKYPGRDDIAGLDNIPVIRFSDVILSLAECACRMHIAGGVDDYLHSSQELLDEVRVRANPNAIPTKEEEYDLLNKILIERRKELAFEGDRFFAIQRTMSDIKRNDCNASVCELLYPDNKFVMPIPQNEINANDSIIQNPGY